MSKGVQELVGEVSHQFLQNLKKKKYLEAKRSRVYVSFKCNNSDIAIRKYHKNDTIMFSIS